MEVVDNLDKGIFFGVVGIGDNEYKDFEVFSVNGERVMRWQLKEKVESGGCFFYKHLPCIDISVINCAAPNYFPPIHYKCVCYTYFNNFSSYPTTPSCLLCKPYLISIFWVPRLHLFTFCGPVNYSHPYCFITLKFWYYFFLSFLAL